MLFSILLLLMIFWSFKKNKTKIEGNVLIVGGSSGLGLSLAIQLQAMGCNISICARTKQRLEMLKDIHGFNIYVVDTTSYKSLKCIDKNFDYIFYCAGYCIPGYFYNLKVKDYKSMINVNYLGCVKVLKYFYKRNKVPFSFIIVASTVCYYTFPGYSAYSPSKAALSSFYNSVEMELQKKNINLYIYYVSTIKSVGYDNENKTKPEFTKFIEGDIDNSCNPDLRAKYLINYIEKGKRKIIVDYETTILKVMPAVDYISEIIYIPIAVMIMPIWRYYVKRLFFYRY